MIWPAWMRSDHPVVRVTVGRWTLSPIWPAAVYGVAGGAALLTLAGATLAGLSTYLSVADWVNADRLMLALAMAGGVGVLLAVVFSSLFGFVAGLLANIKAALAIAGERETQTWPLLRITTLTTADIIGGKGFGVWHSVADMAHCACLLRLFVVAIGGLILAAEMGLAVRSHPEEWQLLWQAIWADAPLMGTNWLAIGVGGAAALAYYLAEPYFSVLYSIALALGVSSISRSRSVAWAWFLSCIWD